MAASIEWWVEVPWVRDEGVEGDAVVLNTFGGVVEFEVKAAEG